MLRKCTPTTYHDATQHIATPPFFFPFLPFPEACMFLLFSSHVVLSSIFPPSLIVVLRRAVTRNKVYYPLQELSISKMQFISLTLSMHYNWKWNIGIFSRHGNKINESTFRKTPNKSATPIRRDRVNYKDSQSRVGILYSRWKQTSWIIIMEINKCISRPQGRSRTYQFLKANEVPFPLRSQWRSVIDCLTLLFCCD